MAKSDALHQKNCVVVEDKLNYPSIRSAKKRRRNIRRSVVLLSSLSAVFIQTELAAKCVEAPDQKRALTLFSRCNSALPRGLILKVSTVTPNAESVKATMR